jgi:hypothetical protein
LNRTADHFAQEFAVQVQDYPRNLPFLYGLWTTGWQQNLPFIQGATTAVNRSESDIYT